jgi:uncharacterized protein (DUF2237 family)
MKATINVLGTPLMTCCLEPKTGWYRDGSCNTDDDDLGSHTVCARVTQEFLEFLQMMGNDLMTPQHGFPGLREGDQWCVCASSWRQAFQAGKACEVLLESTHAAALEIVPLEELMVHAFGLES